MYLLCELTIDSGLGGDLLTMDNLTLHRCHQDYEYKSAMTVHLGSSFTHLGGSVPLVKRLPFGVKGFLQDIFQHLIR